MKKLVAAAVTAVALIAAAPAGADPGQNNGCGWLFHDLAAPGFGQSVADVAREAGMSDTVDLLCRNELP